MEKHKSKGQLEESSAWHQEAKRYLYVYSTCDLTLIYRNFSCNWTRL